MAGNLLTDSVCYIISDLLGTNTKLQYLDLSENYFGELAFYDQQFQKKADKISADFNDDSGPEGPNILSADVHAKLSDEFGLITNNIMSTCQLSLYARVKHSQTSNITTLSQMDGLLHWMWCQSWAEILEVGLLVYRLTCLYINIL